MDEHTHTHTFHSAGAKWDNLTHLPKPCMRLLEEEKQKGWQTEKEGKKKDRQWPWQWEAQQFKKDVASQFRPRWQSAGHRRDAIDKINQFPHCINAHDFSMVSAVKILDTDTTLTVCMCVCGMWKLHLSKRRKTSDWCQTNPPLHST